MTLGIIFHLSVVVEGHGHSLRLTVQDTVGGGAWLTMGVWPQGLPGWFLAGPQQCQCTHFLRQVVRFARLGFLTRESGTLVASSSDVNSADQCHEGGRGWSRAGAQ